jgi:tetrahydromethanopterin S-methyltransferase subunit A
MEWDADVIEALERMTIFMRERLRARIEALVISDRRDRATADDLVRARGASMSALTKENAQPLQPHRWPVLAGAYEVIDESAPVAVCTLASADLARALGRPAGASIVGRAFTENLGVEKVAINIVANPAIRVLVLCGTESRHRVGQTLKALHAHGVSADGRVIDSTGPLPLVRNFQPEAWAIFRAKTEIVDLIDESDVARLRREIADAARRSDGPWPEAWRPAAVEHRATNSPATTKRAEDPAGFLLVSLGPYRDSIVVEHYSRDAELRQIFAGRTAEDLSRTIVGAGAVSDLSHAAYVGRELVKAEIALTRGLTYEQDRDLQLSAVVKPASRE